MAEKEQEKYVFKGVKLTAEQAAFVQKVADGKFEGNFSMALRGIIGEAHRDLKLCKSLS